MSNDFGVYVHIPYCLTKCPYCDFNSYGVGTDYPEDEYTGALMSELESYKNELQGKVPGSIFFGGGTPSLFSAKNIAVVIEGVLHNLGSRDDIEITLEVNPKTADLKKLKEFRSAGVNRISVGIQSFSERKLNYLGRLNSPLEGLQILKDINRAGYENSNLDLIYGTGMETLEELEHDINCALGAGTTHISAYCLTIEPGTVFGKMFSTGRLDLPTDQSIREMMELVNARLESEGYTQYELSNYARPGCECRHNLLYWRGDEYLGLGAGAHSHIKSFASAPWGKRWANYKLPRKYMAEVVKGRRPVDWAECLSKQEALTDRVLMGLRLSGGIDYAQLENEFETKAEIEKISHLTRDRFIKIEDQKIFLTQKGRYYSDDLIAKVLSSMTSL